MTANQDQETKEKLKCKADTSASISFGFTSAILDHPVFLLGVPSTNYLHGHLKTLKSIG
jgi:hypothetical protein